MGVVAAITNQYSGVVRSRSNRKNNILFCNETKKVEISSHVPMLDCMLLIQSKERKKKKLSRPPSRLNFVDIRSRLEHKHVSRRPLPLPLDDRYVRACYRYGAPSPCFRCSTRHFFVKVFLFSRPEFRGIVPFLCVLILQMHR